MPVPAILRARDLLASVATVLTSSDHVRIAAGIEGGGDRGIAERHCGTLLTDDIRLVPIRPAGPIADPRLLDAGKADVGPIRGGTGPGNEPLGAVLVEPAGRIAAEVREGGTQGSGRRAQDGHGIVREHRNEPLWAPTIRVSSRR